MTIAMISVVGWHNVGKTAFVERLIAALKARGLRVATIKHSRTEFDIDHKGTDTWRYRQAGSDVVVISGPERIALIEERKEEATLEEIVGRLPAGIDLVVTEGFKSLPLPKIEVTTREAWETEGRITPEGLLVALISDDGMTGVGDLPVYRSGEVDAVVALLEGRGLVPATRRKL